MNKIIRAGACVLGLVLMLAVVGCSSPAPSVKPTPTAGPSSGGTLAGERIIAEGRVRPAKSAALAFAAAGIVKQVAVVIGDRVESGAVLARIDDTILQKQIVQAQAQVEIAQKQQAQAGAQALVAQKQLAQLKAGGPDSATTAAKAALDAANANYVRVRQGPSAQQLGQLKANLENARAARDQAQSAYDRIGGASNPNIALTPQALALEQATNAFTAAQAAYDDARSHPTSAELAAAWVQVQQAQDVLARLTPSQTLLDVAQAQVDAAQAAVALADSQVKAAAAAVETARAGATNYVLVAPFAGTVMTLDVDPGDYAVPGTPVLQLADTSNWQVETTDLTELNIARVTEGSPVSLSFDAIPDLQLAGRVSRIKPYGDTRQGDIVYTVVVALEHQDARLRWNMTAKVNLESQ